MGAQPLGKLDQQGVARRMSEAVVDVLEVIEVEKYQGELLPWRARNCARFGSPVSMS